MKTQEATPQQRAQIRTELAAGYYERGQMDVALEELGDGEGARSRRMPKIYDIYGLVYAMLGERAKAEENFRQAIALAPNDSDDPRELGRVPVRHRSRARSDARVRAGADAIRSTSTPEIALINAGKCSAALGDTKNGRGLLPPRARRIARQSDRRVQPCAPRVSRVARRRSARVDAPGDAADTRRRPKRSISACASSASRAIARRRDRTSRSCATAGPIRRKRRRSPAEGCE